MSRNQNNSVRSSIRAANSPLDSHHVWRRDKMKSEPTASQRRRTLQRMTSLNTENPRNTATPDSLGILMYCQRTNSPSINASATLNRNSFVMKSNFMICMFYQVIEFYTEVVQKETSL